ncbi:hypothetical protein H4R24_001901 [Coemansia sp. RSA 988]|nr:hypothetical protein H4R24_001901 [Coemansia sp. RSA 988]
MQQPGLAPNEGKRSSVLDRIRFIEKTHGPVSNSAPAAGQQRAKLRLPKLIEEQQPAAANAAEAPPTSAGALPASPITPKAGNEPTRIPRLAPPLQTAAHQMPSPVLSDAGSLVTPAAVGENGKSPVVSLRQLQHSGQLHSPRQEPNPQLSVDESELPNGVHSRSASTESSASEAVMVEHTLYANQSASSSDFEFLDPVPAAADDAHAEQRARARHHPRKSLGGIRSRAPPASSRKYHKFFQPDDSSSHSLHCALDDELPAEVSGAPALRSTKSLTSVISSNQSPVDKKNPKLAEGHSLLSRLASLTASRPNVQDLVSNRSSPKFVKRSHHFSASPATTAATTRSPIVWSRSSERRRYK